MTTPAERRKQFAEVDAIWALEGFTEADKSPEMIRRREAIIDGSMTTAEAVAEAVAEAIAEAKADKAKAAVAQPKMPTQSIEEWFKLMNERTNEIAMNEDLRKKIAKLTK